MAAKSTISGLFARSPFRPMQEHAAVAANCAAQTINLFTALCQNDKEAVRATYREISTLESAADEIKNDMRAHLPKSLFLPVDRRDLLEILDLQDSIADTAQSIGGLIYERRMSVPEGLEEPLMSLVRRSVDACKHCSNIINELDELVSTGFRGRESDAVSNMVNELNRIESDTDQMGTDLSRALFAQEDNMNPVSVILWYELIKMIGTMADYAERVGNRLRLLLAR